MTIPPKREDTLFVRSIEKAFRVLTAFGAGHSSLSLAQVAQATGLDKSAAQRFTHTLERLGYLRKAPETRHFSLTPRTLEPGYHYMRASSILDRAVPYLLELSRATEESVSLSVPDGTEIVYVARLISRHMVSSNVIVGTRLPAYCTAPGLAMLARLPLSEAKSVLCKSELRAYTANTTTSMAELMAKLEQTQRKGYAMAVEEIFASDISLGVALTGPCNETLGAVSLSVSRVRLSPEEAEARFAPLLLATAQAMSAQVLPGEVT